MLFILGERKNASMAKYKAIIFDMDGTLLNTIEDLYLSLNHALSAYGYPCRTRAEVQSYIGDGMDVLIMRAMPDELKEDIDGDKEKFAVFVEKCQAVGEAFKEYYIEHGEDNTKPYDGIIALLKALKQSKIKTAVVSNKMQIAVERLNDRLFAGLINVAVGDGVGLKLKPYPDMLLHALNRLGVDKADAVFVGDGDTDILAAKSAGLGCISVCYGYRDEDFLRSHGGKSFAHDVKELASILDIKI